MIRYACLTGLVALAACASPPAHFYQLETQAAAVPVVQHASAVCVSGVTIPRVLDRTQLVRTTNDEEIEVSSQDRWAAPLDALIQQALTQDLSVRLPDGKVAPANAGAGCSNVAIDVMRFESDMAGRTNLDVFWSVAGSDPAKPLATHHEQIELTAGNGSFPGVASAMSQAVGMLADRIASELPQP